ncbi:hypothetical protein EVAR_99704_1 [Eumeta japonica]|uniref:Uncharacterized protein n=1 Tax=Eumeta variegata TaxID=151549 RepID=A0A4C1ZQM0_EUMVA|nr:hypothetical protein EVAR_99704_1 [Eumeta japonica]
MARGCRGLMLSLLVLRIATAVTPVVKIANSVALLCDETLLLMQRNNTKKPYHWQYQAEHNEDDGFSRIIEVQTSRRATRIYVVNDDCSPWIFATSGCHQCGAGLGGRVRISVGGRSGPMERRGADGGDAVGNNRNSLIERDKPFIGAIFTEETKGGSVELAFKYAVYRINKEKATLPHSTLVYDIQYAPGRDTFKAYKKGKRSLNSFRCCVSSGETGRRVVVERGRESVCVREKSLDIKGEAICSMHTRAQLRAKASMEKLFDLVQSAPRRPKESLYFSGSGLTEWQWTTGIFNHWLKRNSGSCYFASVFCESVTNRTGHAGSFTCCGQVSSRMALTHEGAARSGTTVDDTDDD